MKVGALEETITVSAESPVVDTQSITTRTVMTREPNGRDPDGPQHPGGRHHDPGDVDRGRRRRRAVARRRRGPATCSSRRLQYRGSGDTVQTIEGMRLNNLCAQGQYSGVY